MHDNFLEPIKTPSEVSNAWDIAYHCKTNEWTRMNNVGKGFNHVNRVFVRRFMILDPVF